MKTVLLYYFYIPQNKGITNIYDLHFKHLKHYLYLFNRKIIILGIDDTNDLETIEYFKKIIKNKLEDDNIEFYVSENHKEYRDGKIFKEFLMDKLDDYEDSLVFFAHSKGTHDQNNENTEMWISSMYYFNLEFMDDVINKILNSRYISYGANYMHWRFRNKFSWIYSGSFQWININKLKKFISELHYNIDDIYEKNLKRYFAEDLLGNLYNSELQAHYKMNNNMEHFNDYTQIQNHIKFIYGMDEHKKFIEFYNSIK